MSRKEPGFAERLQTAAKARQAQQQAGRNLFAQLTWIWD
jgi:hypothetical protein